MAKICHQLMFIYELLTLPPPVSGGLSLLSNCAKSRTPAARGHDLLLAALTKSINPVNLAPAANSVLLLAALAKSCKSCKLFSPAAANSSNSPFFLPLAALTKSINPVNLSEPRRGDTTATPVPPLRGSVLWLAAHTVGLHPRLLCAALTGL